MFRRLSTISLFLMMFAAACLLQNQVALGSQSGSEKNHGVKKGALKTDFIATDDWFLGGDLGQILCPGEEFTGNPFQPCPPGTNIHVRDSIGMSQASSDDPRVTGILTYYFNGNFDTYFTGPVWGTWTLEVAACNGVWEGIWNGQRTLLPGQPGPVGMGTWIGTLQLTGHGHGECVDGLQFSATEIITTFTPFPVAYEMVLPCGDITCLPEGVMTGVILEPGKN